MASSTRPRLSWIWVATSVTSGPALSVHGVPSAVASVLDDRQPPSTRVNRPKSLPPMPTDTRSVSAVMAGTCLAITSSDVAPLQVTSVSAIDTPSRTGPLVATTLA